MAKSFYEEGLHLWQVSFNQPPVRAYSMHSMVNIEAATAEEAIEKLKAQYPSAKVRDLNHKGYIDIK